MIRLIQRRLIIPQGDTGTFTIPIQGTMVEGDKAILAIYDNLTQTNVLELEPSEITSETLSFNFVPEHTLSLEPDNRGNRYSWDIIIMRQPYKDANDETQYAQIDSYYAAFRLPPCVIKRVTRNVQK